MNPSPGLHHGVPFAEYLAWPAVDFTVLKEMRRSPRHARHAALSPREDTPALILGEALHYAVWQPDLWAVRYGVAPRVDRRTRAGKLEWQAWSEAHPHAVALSGEEYDTVDAMAWAVREHAGPLVLGTGAAEMSVLWTDERTGERVKIRPDWLTLWQDWPVIVDLKSCRDASPHDFAGSVARYFYHVQAALYLDMLDALAPHPRRFFWLAVEKTAPHGVAVYEPDEQALSQGRDEWRRYLAQWAECKRTGEWPGYPLGPAPLSLPRWAVDPYLQEAT